MNQWVRRAGLEILSVAVPAGLVMLAAPGPFAWSVAAGLLGCALLPLRHLWPPLAVIGALPAIAGGLGWPSSTVALFALGRRWGRLERTLLWFVSVVVAAVVPVLVTQDLGWRSIVLTVLFAALSAGSPLGVGLLTATRERLTTSLRELEDAREATVAARESAARAEERARIGREVHDAVGHHATLIAVGAAALAASTQEEPTREAAERLRAQAKEALGEMRSALGLVPTQDRPGSLRQLVDRARATGLDVLYETRGDAVPLSAAADRALYRVVQEALTNAARHAPGSTVRVFVDRRPASEVRVEVCNGPGRPVPGAFGVGGAGLAGLAERVRSAGGTLTSGVVENGGGWRVAATLHHPEPAPGPPRVGV
ncbi:hypothetical protein GCM10009836_54650 [Pseudonocardia ailaonensis]|uniref:histidine kinase n=1 Tax=Pseudonocardia ailaonensis TaxID=367279 RepID=A0ABN2NGQ9_9PSEU